MAPGNTEQSLVMQSRITFEIRLKCVERNYLQNRKSVYWTGTVISITRNHPTACVS
jgi:hypothetical protein